MARQPSIETQLKRKLKEYKKKGKDDYWLASYERGWRQVKSNKKD